jgi:hypothetical protein
MSVFFSGVFGKNLGSRFGGHSEFFPREFRKSSGVSQNLTPFVNYEAG